MSERLIEILAALGEAEVARIVRATGDREALGLDRNFDEWTHDGQSCPPGDWRTWILMAGRGFGKTRAGAEWIAAAARADGALRIALVAATLEEARRVMVEGASGLLAVAAHDIAGWAPSRRLVKFTSGAEATLFSGASPGQLRGPEHHLAWCDELAKWEKPGETWDMLQLGMRLGERPRVLVTTTPRPGAALTRIMAAPGSVTTRGRTRANPHLPEAFVSAVHDLYAGTRLGRQELDGELLTDAAGALWTVELIERCRISPLPLAGGVDSAFLPLGGRRLGGAEREGAASGLRGPGFTRTLIAVDPPSGDGTCGIVACAKDAAGHAHVLADHSVTARSPEGWARAVAAAAAIHATDEVVAEANQGGKMVKAVLMTADPRLRVKSVTAILGKSERAEPVAHLFEAGKAWLHGRFPELEAELLGMIAGGGYEGPGTSPDRADAMVWGVTELALGKERAEPRIWVL